LEIGIEIGIAKFCPNNNRSRKKRNPMSFHAYAMIKARALGMLMNGADGSIPKVVDRAVAEWRARGKSIGNAEVARIKRELKARVAAEKGLNP
jgi:hypothetical protein